MNNEFQTHEIIQQRLHNLASSDVNEIREIARHMREMEKNAQKSNLRMQEAEYRHSLKQGFSDIKEQDYSIVERFFDGRGNFYYQLKLFDCRIDKIECYRYEGFPARYFNLTLQFKNAEGYKSIDSPLYDDKTLSSKSKLKLTILGFFCVGELKLQADAWRWIQNFLVQRMNYAHVTEIPYNPGWWEQNGKWRFVTAEDEENLFPSECIRQFHMERITGVTVKEIVEELLVEIKETPKSYAGVLLIYRLNALMVSLLEELSFSSGIAFIGRKAETVAKTFLRTMHNDVDVINLDVDAMGMILKRVKMLQDTPVIFKISNPDNQTVRNKLDKIMSCMQAGCMEGRKVSRTFVFCLEKFSLKFPMEDLIVLDTDKIIFSGVSISFVKMQSYVISEVENAGGYWVNEMRRLHEDYTREDTDKRISMSRTIVSVLSKMFRLDEMRGQPYEELEGILASGKDEIERQSVSSEGIVVETFREKVIELVDRGKICVADRKNKSVSGDCETIYYDDMYYYFTKNTVDVICRFSNIGYCSLLSLKKQLVQQEALKQYAQTTGRKPEYEIDFRVCNVQGKPKDLSGLAIKCEFFDVIGGIKLYERG